MNWEDVVKRDDIVGGDMEAQEDGNIYRGPIKSIELKNGDVDITLEWCATTPAPGNPGSGDWKLHNIPVASVSMEIKPRELSDKRVMVSVPGLGVWVIYPKGGSKLDPAKVAGLKVG